MKVERRTYYIANDGSEFRDKAKCLDHDALLSVVAAIMAPLPARPKSDSCSFENGHGYIQHDEASWTQARDALLDLARPYCRDLAKWVTATAEPSWPSRAIGEYCPNVIYNAWSRFACTDRLFREWGQPYYRIHPGQAEQFQVN